MVLIFNYINLFYSEEIKNATIEYFSVVKICLSNM